MWVLAAGGLGGCGHEPSEPSPAFLARPSVNAVDNDQGPSEPEPEPAPQDEYLGPLTTEADWFALPAFTEEAAALPVGATYATDGNDEATVKTLKALGYLPQADTTWLRRADLLAPEVLVPSVMAELPHVDAIAVISTYRANIDDQYIYPTLASMFRALPETAIINVLVGNGRIDYLRPDRLSAYLPAEQVRRVHVMAPPITTSDFFAESDQTISGKATWNYARALRSYHGSEHLLLCEDDIEMAHDALSAVQPYLEAHLYEMYALYNDHCGSIKETWSSPHTRLTLGSWPVRQCSDYPTTQAFLYSAKVAQPLGEHLIIRAGREPYDWLAGRYFGPSMPSIGFVWPSVVQHRGYVTTGLSGLAPISGCYEP